MAKIYTIGFTKKKASRFFELLDDADVTKIIDTRVNNTSQLSGFAKAADLEFFADKIINAKYEHNPDFAPSKELLKKYRQKEITWKEYEIEYLNLLDLRKIKQKVNVDDLHKGCLLCSEHEPDYCHRRLLAEYLEQAHTDVEIVHLL